MKKLIFTKSTLTGLLDLVTIDQCVNRRGKIVWTTKQVLMLVDKQGAQLSSAQFRSNAFKKAEKFFIDCGWDVREQKTTYCFGTEQQVKNWVDNLPDANLPLVVKQPDMVLVKPAGFISIVDCAECEA